MFIYNFFFMSILIFTFVLILTAPQEKEKDNYRKSKCCDADIIYSFTQYPRNCRVKTYTCSKCGKDASNRI